MATLFVTTRSGRLMATLFVPRRHPARRGRLMAALLVLIRRGAAG